MPRLELPGGLAPQPVPPRPRPLHPTPRIAGSAMSGVPGNASDRPAGWQTTRAVVRIVPYPACELPGTTRVPSSHWLDASSAKGDTWDSGTQIPSTFYF